MSNDLKKRFKKTFLGLSLVFLLLFLFRLYYGFRVVTVGTEQETYFSDRIATKNNYATQNYKIENSSQSPISVDQKYEKVAQVKTKTSDFEKDEKQSKSAIERSNAIIQYQQKNGNNGNRRISLVIGVPPNNFDKLYTDLVRIGKIEAKQIVKTDKTNEYKQLNAKKESLEKIRNSLVELKAKGGKIEEYMNLENRILEIESDLQDLGVSLGDFDDENEFCTVQFLLQEQKDESISLTHRIKVALEWSIKIQLQIMMAAAFMALFAYLLILLIDKTKVWTTLFRKKEEIK